MADPELQPLPPERRNGPPRWEVWQDGQRLGIVQETHLGGARRPFYEAIAPHPRTGKPISLELHTDRQNRVDVLVRFHANPEESGSTGPRSMIREGQLSSGVTDAGRAASRM